LQPPSSSSSSRNRRCSRQPCWLAVPQKQQQLQQLSLLPRQLLQPQSQQLGTKSLMLQQLLLRLLWTQQQRLGKDSMLLQLRLILLFCQRMWQQLMLVQQTRQVQQ
jgi:hypothetical protein